MADGWADTLGNTDGIHVGTLVLVGFVLGWLDDLADMDEIMDGCDVGLVDRLGTIED